MVSLPPSPSLRIEYEMLEALKQNHITSDLETRKPLSPAHAPKFTETE
jgi:hypothetical protein